MKNLEIHFVIYALVCLPGCRDTSACGTGLSFFLGDPDKAAITSEILPVCFTGYRFESALSEEKRSPRRKDVKRKARSNFFFNAFQCFRITLAVIYS